MAEMGKEDFKGIGENENGKSYIDKRQGNFVS